MTPDLYQNSARLFPCCGCNCASLRERLQCSSAQTNDSKRQFRVWINSFTNFLLTFCSFLDYTTQDHWVMFRDDVCITHQYGILNTPRHTQFVRIDCVSQIYILYFATDQLLSYSWVHFDKIFYLFISSASSKTWSQQISLFCVICKFLTFEWTNESFLKLVAIERAYTSSKYMCYS